VSRPFERRGSIGNVVAEELRGSFLGDQSRIGQQPISKGLEPSLTSDLRLGPSLRLVGQVDVFDTRFGVSGHQCGPQLVGEPALLFDRGQHRGPTCVQLPQIPQALLERPQLAVIETSGCLFAISGDERNSGALVE
jgi:hypothetical protein